jgi:hypothetical protein
MDLASLARTVVIDRLIKLESDAAHLHVLACVAEAAAFMARQRADVAQSVLSAVKIWIALLPDDAKLELRAPRPGADDPALRLGVKVCLPIPKPDREITSCPAPTFPAPPNSARLPTGQETMPRSVSAPGPAPG